MIKNPKVVVLGAGFAGISAVKSLKKLLPTAEVQIITPDPYHCYTPDLYEVATAVLEHEFKSDFEHLKKTVAIPLSTILPKGVNVLVDSAKKIDLVNRIIETKLGKQINYDYLVVATGSVTNYYNIAGADQFSHPFKNINDAINIRDDIEELIRDGDQPMRLVIAGGGFSGVELSAEMHGYLQDLAKKYHKPQAEISIIEATAQLLPGMPAWSQEMAEKRLRALGIKVKVNFTILEVKKTAVLGKDDQREPFDYLIWTTGIRGVDGLQLAGLAVNKKGQIGVNAKMQIESYPEAFVVGDMAEHINPINQKPTPSTAWAAIGQGTVAGINIAALAGGGLIKDYIPPQTAFVVPMGQKYALSNILDLKLIGWPVWIIKQLIALKYLTSLMPLHKAISFWFKGVSLFTHND